MFIQTNAGQTRISRITEIDPSVASFIQIKETDPELVADIEDALSFAQEEAPVTTPKIHPNYPKNAFGMRHTAQWWENRRKFEGRNI